jgi:hypothetical protein
MSAALKIDAHHFPRSGAAIRESTLQGKGHDRIVGETECAGRVRRLRTQSLLRLFERAAHGRRLGSWHLPLEEIRVVSNWLIICGKMNHIQRLCFSPARSSSITRA